LFDDLLLDSRRKGKQKPKKKEEKKFKREKRGIFQYRRNSELGIENKTATGPFLSFMYRDEVEFLCWC